MDIFLTIRQHALDRERKAIVFNEESITYEELYRTICSNQSRFLENGIKCGGKVILQTDDQREFCILFLSLLAHGCWVIPVSMDLTHCELEEIIDMTSAVCINNIEIYMKPLTVGLCDKMRGVNVDGDKCGIYHMTSGSTGKMKLCVRTLNALLSEARSFVRTFSFVSEDKIISCAPLYHSYALGAVILPAMISGACIYAIRKFLPRKVLKIADEYKVTILIMVPIMAESLCKVYTNDSYSLLSVRVALVGAGAISVDLYKYFVDKFGIFLMSNYGSTETGGLISRVSALPYHSVGKTMDGVEFKICDDEGNRVSQNQEGELCVKTKGMLEGYYQNEGAIFDSEGFFHMGDLAVYDAEQNIFIKGRKKLMINVGGKKVNPVEIENVIMELDGVKECAVIGVRRGDKEIVKAFVVLGAAEKKQVKEFCRERLSQYKVPSVYEFVSELPRLSIGKIDRKKLKDAYIGEV